MDPQGNLTEAFRINAENTPIIIDLIEGYGSIEDAIINAEEGIDIIPSRIENVTLDSKLALSKAPLHTVLSDLLEPIRGNYDLIMLDCPPMMGHAVTAASLYSDIILVPLNPDKFSANGLQILKKEIININKQYKTSIQHKVFLNKFSGNTILSDKAIQTTIAQEAEDGNALMTAIRLTQEIPNIIDNGLNLFSSLKSSTARDDFDLLTRELLNIKF